MLSTTAVAVSLIAGMAVSTSLYFQQRTATGRATFAESQQRRPRTDAESARNQETAERLRARQTADFLTEMLRGVGPSVALGRDTRVLADILDETARRVGRDLTGQPEVEADLRGTLGLTFREIGDFAKAEAMQREALRLETASFPPHHERILRTLNRLALVRLDLGDLTEAESLLRRALALSDAAPASR